MVGRELHTICPSGEDHQGDARGERTTDYGKCNNDVPGSMTTVWKSSTQRMTVHKVWGWMVMGKEDMFLMSFVLLV